MLGLSLLFYEAQRSGKLPPTNRVRWRNDSNLGDKAPNGADAEGGMHDAGDHLKINFPGAWSLGQLAWAAIEFKKGFALAGQTQHVKDVMRHVASYYVKCHYQDFGYVAMVRREGEGRGERLAVSNSPFSCAFFYSSRPAHARPHPFPHPMATVAELQTLPVRQAHRDRERETEKQGEGKESAREMKANPTHPLTRPPPLPPTAPLPRASPPRRPRPGALACSRPCCASRTRRPPSASTRPSWA